MEIYKDYTYMHNVHYNTACISSTYNVDDIPVFSFSLCPSSSFYMYGIYAFEYIENIYEYI